MRIILTIILFTLSFMHAFPVHIDWDYIPNKGYVYEITNKEAQKILTKHVPDSIIESYLHTLIDTFCVDSGWKNRPTQGHFILTSIKENKVYCEYTSVFPYQVYLYKEYGNLSIQVIDLDGNVREDAKVKIRRTRIAADPETKIYRIESQWVRKGNSIATVELEGFRSVFNIEKQEVAKWNNSYYHNYDGGPDFYSYMLTDKNKYRPNDLLRFKSYALNSWKQPIKKDLSVWLSGNRIYKKISTVSPHRPGSFSGEITLSNSLELKLDRNYSLYLKNDNGQIVSSCSFKFEDYELFGNELEINLQKEVHYAGEENTLEIKATDVNGLILKDAKAIVIVKPLAIKESFEPVLILSDTLLNKELTLEPDKPTLVNIPSEIFKQSNARYEVEVTVFNSEYERLNKRTTGLHLFSKYELITFFDKNTIHFSLMDNGKPMQNVPSKLIVDGNDPKEITLPYKEPINVAVKNYRILNAYVSKDITLSHLNPELRIEGGIKKDSFSIYLLNPQQIDISWLIYQGTALIEKGAGKTFEHSSYIYNREQNYFVEMFYSFGGVDKSIKRQFVFRKEKLDVDIDLPERIYPGQTVDANITVTNQYGQPVKGVDLTALATNSMLQYDVPDINYYGGTSKARPVSDKFSKQAVDKRNAILNLDYKKWNKLAQLDTMRYYQFTYPTKDGFRYEIEIDSLTQFAPYIMENGQAKTIYIIELNKKPIYYSWADSPSKYSFEVQPDTFVSLSLRLHNKVIVIDSLKFAKGKKTILSYNGNKLPKEARAYTLSNEFTNIEKTHHILYTSSFKPKPYIRYRYLESNNEFIPITNYGSYKTTVVGPISQGYKKYIQEGTYQIVYRHAGGYSYDFEDNIVYKLSDTTLLPKKLYNTYYSPLRNLNDRVLIKREFIKNQAYTPKSPFNYTARTLYAKKSNGDFTINLPYSEEHSGLAVVLFQEFKTGKTGAYFYGKHDEFLTHKLIPTGCYNIIALFNNGNYLKMPQVNLSANIHLYINFSEEHLVKSDSSSQNWLAQHVWHVEEIKHASSKPTEKEYQEYSYYDKVDGNITGTILDGSTNQPLIGATVLIKGSTIGTVTDLDGRFALNIESYNSTLIIDYIGYIREEVSVNIGSDLEVLLTPDILELDEIVVVGYGVQRKSDLTGSISSVSSSDVNAITDKDILEQEQLEATKEAEKQLYQELLKLNSIRSNFNDVAIWEPRLYTDRKGKANFSVTFPDDITKWNATVYAMNRFLQTGTGRMQIKSYKPITAELRTPRFLVKGDSANIIGKVINNSNDSTLTGTIKWKDSTVPSSDDISFSSHFTSVYSVCPMVGDSLSNQFTFTRNDGYFDGERRTIPLQEPGIVRADGLLNTLKAGESRIIKATDEPVHIQLYDNQLDIYSNEISYLINYRYACNEQLASKLVGLLCHKMLTEAKGEEFTYLNVIEKIIKELLKNQNTQHLWSWWNQSENTSYWISSHVLRSLYLAKKQGFSVPLNLQDLEQKMVVRFDYDKGFNMKDLDLLNALSLWEVRLDYKRYTDSLSQEILIYESQEEDKRTRSYLHEKLLIEDIKQNLGLPFLLDSILKHKQETVKGEVYFQEDKKNSYWYYNNFSSNLVAYRMISKDSSMAHLKQAMQLYFIAQRQSYFWNTYQSANAMLAILPDLIMEGFAGRKSEVFISGDLHQKVDSFPYTLVLPPGQEINLVKNSGLPMYFMQYNYERVTEAKKGVEGFNIKTFFEDDIKMLTAGTPVKIITEVEVTKSTDIEYVMIEIPIPASCSYYNKSNKTQHEVHREYFKEKTVVFCIGLQKGKYYFEVELLPRFTGTYIINPAQVSLMYFPVVNANTEIRKVIVQEVEF